jgi:hypothetical protein
MIKIVFKILFNLLNPIFVKLKIRIQNMEKNYKKEGKYGYYEAG